MDEKEQKKLRTIKRYSNRKLYDMEQSKYITLAETFSSTGNDTRQDESQKINITAKTELKVP